jgi:hypothetical protein
MDEQVADGEGAQRRDAVERKPCGDQPRPSRSAGYRVVHHSFRYVLAGDTVTRILSGAPMQLKVTEVDERFIYCGPSGIGWKFDRATGIEVDEEIGSGPEFGIALSYLIHPTESAEGQP